jgi:putative transposase
MESFFALLQKNVPGRQRWSGRDQVRLAIITRIERTVEYETINQATHAA